MQLLVNHIPHKIKLQEGTMDRDLQEEKLKDIWLSLRLSTYDSNNLLDTFKQLLLH